MKKTTIDQRIENSINDFFSSENISGGDKLSCTNNASFLRNEPKVIFTEKTDTFVKILKMILLFLPGAFFLYFSSIFFLYAFFISKMSVLDFGFGFALWVLSAVMTIFGFGKITSLKNLLIPASICALSFILFMGSLFLPETVQVKFLFEYSAYLFPVVLIAPFLAKFLVDKIEVSEVKRF